MFCPLFINVTKHIFTYTFFYFTYWVLLPLKADGGGWRTSTKGYPQCGVL